MEQLRFQGNNIIQAFFITLSRKFDCSFGIFAGLTVEDSALARAISSFDGPQALTPRVRRQAEDAARSESFKVCF